VNKFTKEIIGIGGFPHSEIVGSMLAHSSPTLIAACHVLHRLYMPRHPRIALTSRLRVHTTNDSAGNVDQQIGDHSANAACMMRMILSQLVFIERTDPGWPESHTETGADTASI
jgi:hypothetical protein